MRFGHIYSPGPRKLQQAFAEKKATEIDFGETEDLPCKKALLYDGPGHAELSKSWLNY